MAPELRRSVDKASELARALGYTVSECDFRDGTVMVDCAGHGELFELHYRADPATGYLRWHHGFLHGGTRGDRHPTWREVEALLRQYASPYS